MTALCVKDALLLPDFASIDPAGLAARLDKQLSSNLEAIEQLLRSQDNLSYKDLVPALEQLGDEVDRLWGPLSHLHGVGNKEDIRAAFDECLPKLTDYATKLGQNKSLYLAFLGLLDSAEFSQLSQPQQQFVKLQIKDFKLAGVALNPQEQIEYGQLKQQIAKLSTRFSNHLMDATQAWSKHVSDRNDLLGLPESALQQAKESAKAQDLEGIY